MARIHAFLDDSGTIVIYYTGDAALAGKRLYLNPTVTSGGITWLCNTNDLPFKYLPASCRNEISGPPPSS
ncbi:MAG: hypothetical protein K0R03_2457 [Moraxellaceae bacterium]|nr:hypothetical protein [Moraxellaceae bacterium]